MLIYLGLSALVVFLAALAFLLLGEPSSLAATHLVFALAVVPLVFAAIAHFVPVLTRSASAPRGIWLAPLLLQLTGFVVVLHFFGAVHTGVLNSAAVVSLLLALAVIGWLVVRARSSLGKPHPGWRWYLASIFFLVIGLAMVPAMHYWPAQRQALRLLHLHLNTLGFIGLTAIGTLQVLLPTVLSGPDSDAAARLRQDLPLAVAGVLLVGLGAAFLALSLAGAGFLFCIAGRPGLSWLRRYGLPAIFADGAAAALAASLCGFLLLLAFGIAHALGLLEGRHAIPGFMAAFLLPLVTGALSQLLPVWRYPGRRTPVRDRMREALIKRGAMRASLFICGGVLLALGHSEGLWLAAIGLLSFLYVLVGSFCFPLSK